MSDEIKTDAAATEGCAAVPGSTVTPTDRKVLIVAAMVCIAIFCGAFITFGFLIDPVAGVACIAFIAWWLGSAAAGVLKDDKDADPSSVLMSDGANNER